jgi:hypothetical protein
MNLRTTKHRVFVLILLTLLAGGLACTAWGMGPGWPGGAGVRRSDGRVCRNVSRLSPNEGPVWSPPARFHSDTKMGTVSAALGGGYIHGSFYGPETQRFGWLIKMSLSSFLFWDGTQIKLDRY